MIDLIGVWFMVSVSVGMGVFYLLRALIDADGLAIVANWLALIGIRFPGLVRPETTMDILTHLEATDHPKLAKLFSCPYCLGMWFTGSLVLLFSLMMGLHLWLFLLCWLGAAGIMSFLIDHFEGKIGLPLTGVEEARESQRLRVLVELSSIRDDVDEHLPMSHTKDEFNSLMDSAGVLIEEAVRKGSGE